MARVCEFSTRLEHNRKGRKRKSPAYRDPRAAEYLVPGLTAPPPSPAIAPPSAAASPAAWPSPEHEAATVADRMEAWRDAFHPSTPDQEWLFRQIVELSLGIDRCRHHEGLIRAEQARRAALCWADDRRLAAEEIGAGLSDDPALTVRRLRATAQGCDWLLERWRALGRVLDARGEWNRAQTHLAFDLQGIPRALRTPTPWDPCDPETPIPSALVRREIRRLERLQSTALNELDDAERAAAEIGLALEPGGALASIRRHETNCLRHLLRARELFEALQQGEPIECTDPDAVSPRAANPAAERPVPPPAPNRAPAEAVAAPEREGPPAQSELATLPYFKNGAAPAPNPVPALGYRAPQPPGSSPVQASHRAWPTLREALNPSLRYESRA